MQKDKRGTWFVFAAALLYSVGGLCIKVIPWNAMSINSARNTLSILVVSVFLLALRHPLRVNRWILLGGLCMCGTNVLYSIANKLTTAANTIVLQFTAPIFVILLGILFWKRKPTALDLSACVIVLLGVIFFFVDGLSAGGMLGNVLAVISGVSYAGVFLMNDLPEADPLCSVFWGSVMSAVIGLPFWLKETNYSCIVVTGILVLGFLQVGLAYVLMSLGLQTTPAIRASLITGIEPILNPIWVAVFYHETVGAMALIGAVIVIGGVVGYNVLKSRETTVKK